MKHALIFLLWLAGAYAGLCALVFLLQEGLLFFPASSDARAAAELQPFEQVVTTDEVRLAGWLIPARAPRAAPLVFYFGGNAEDISRTGLDASARVDANFVLMNYRGYGKSEGSPSQAGLVADAVHVYDEMIRLAPHNGRRVVFGRSLGAGVGVQLAARRHIDGAVLVTPFDSVRNLARRHYPWLPVSLLLKHPFDSSALAPELDLPALFLVAERDEIAPPAHARALAERWRGSTKVVTIPAVGHNTIGSQREFWEPIRALLKSL